MIDLLLAVGLVLLGIGIGLFGFYWYSLHRMKKYLTISQGDYADFLNFLIEEEKK